MILERQRENETEFSLLAGAGIAGVAHVGMNAVVKRMFTPKTALNRVGAAIFQTGVRHKKLGIQIHPAIRRITDIVTGPELSLIYEHGLTSTREARKHIVSGLSSVKGTLGDTIAGIHGIVAGKRSRITSRIMDRFPMASLSRVAKKTDNIAAGIAGVGMMAAEPVLPIYNAVRTAISESKMGERIIRDRGLKGSLSGARKGIARHLEDYVVSPSLNLAQDVGAAGRDAWDRHASLRDAAKRLVGL